MTFKDLLMEEKDELIVAYWASISSYPEVFCKKVFLKISPNSQGNTCAKDSSLSLVSQQLY